MTRWVESLTAFSLAWAAWLWRICWQAAVVIAIAWLLTLLLRQRSSRLRSWIWRLAYIKLLLLFVWTSSINLPLLPPMAGLGDNSPLGHDHDSSFSGNPSLNHDSSFSRDSQRSAPSPVDTPAPYEAATGGRAAAPTDSKLPNDATLSADAKSTSLDNLPSASAPLSPTSAPAARFTLLSGLLLVWLLGMLLVLGWLAWETTLVLRLRRSVRIIQSDPLKALVDEVRQQMEIRSTVQVGESNTAVGPMLVKFLTPCIVFPSGVLSSSPSPLMGEGRGEGVSFSPTGEGRGERESEPSHLGRGQGEGAGASLTLDEIRLVLAHELAHVKRHDLAWNALAAVVHVLLYFHPLVWLASRWSRQEQELACDELVITRLHVAGHTYGQLLIKIVRQIGRNFPTGMAVIGMASSYHTLSRRLIAMKHIRNFSRRQVLVGGLIVALLGAIAIVPWRLVAKEGSGFGVAPIPYKAATGGRAAAPVDTDTSTPLGATPPFSRDAQRSASPPTAAKLELAQADDSASRKNQHKGTSAVNQQAPGTPPVSGTAGVPGAAEGQGTTPLEAGAPAAGAPGTPVGPGPAVTAEELAARQKRVEQATAALKKLLVGRWRDSAGKEVEFFADDSYDDLGAKILLISGTEMRDGKAFRVTHHARGRGAWSVSAYPDAPQDNHLQITENPQQVWDAAFEISTPPGTVDLGANYHILRLDDSFLRLKYSLSNDTLFFRRVDDKAEEQKFADGPRALFAAAQLTPEEASDLLAILKNEQIDAATLETFSRVLQAFQHQISLKQLFGMTPEEVTAFKELLQQSGNHRHDLYKLSAAGQLSPVESSAVAKIKEVDKAFDEFVAPLAGAIPVGNAMITNGLPGLRNRWELAGGRGGGQGGGLMGTLREGREIGDTDLKALVKLMKFVEELDQWLQQAVFDMQTSPQF